jgi:aldehyde:ferredoxin oxidoreductase
LTPSQTIRWRQPEEDTLPDRFLGTPLPTDPGAVLTRKRLQELVAEYHRQRGWHARGR